MQHGFILTDKPSRQMTNHDYIHQLNESIYDILVASNKHKSIYYTRTTANSNSNFQLGDYVLVKYPSRPPTKLSPILKGPMVIIEKLNHGFLCQDLITQSQLEISEDRLTKFFPPSPDVNVSDIAASDNFEQIVRQILRWKGNPKRKRDLFFEILWDDGDITWEPWSNVRDLALMDQFLLDHPDLKIK
jgi:hypothetical protein